MSKTTLNGAANLAFNALHECKPYPGAEKQYSDAIQALRDALGDIANTKNLTATPEQFVRHLQTTAADALHASPPLPQQGEEQTASMPALPGPFLTHAGECEERGHWYSAAQMRDYGLKCRAAALQGVEAVEIEALRELLLNPVAVHNNMLTGTIAKIDMAQLAHVHGGDTLDRWLAFQRWEQGGEAKHAAQIDRAIRQEERACRAEDALIDLINQISKTNPVDDHGHNLKMNMAYIKAVELLDASASAEAICAAPAGLGEAKAVAPERFFMDHGLWHDRVTGQHMYTQDQYDEESRACIAQGKQDAEIERLTAIEAEKK